MIIITDIVNIITIIISSIIINVVIIVFILLLLIIQLLLLLLLILLLLLSLSVSGRMTCRAILANVGYQQGSLQVARLIQLDAEDDYKNSLTNYPPQKSREIK